MAGPAIERRLAVGAEPLHDDSTHFRVWSPRRRTVEVVIDEDGEEEIHRLEAEEEGYFGGLVRGARAGVHYRYRLDGGRRFADPASRWQPEGPHGPSVVIDPSAFEWSDRGWEGVALEGQVLYELHAGTFTPEGTWEAATAMLPVLAEDGITVVELMPVAEFPGRFGWGYDGVLPFAPYHGYGAPDTLRRFVDRAHAVGLGVILDVVYNHLGPDGNVLPEFSDDYFSREYRTDWGDPFNFDGPGSEAVREYVLSNVEYWIGEFHLDGFRLDATQALHDRSDDHIVAAMVRRARAAACGRRVVIVAENEPQDVRLIRPTAGGGYGVDALWNDDFHHTAIVALTGRRQAYYSDYGGSPAEFVAAAKHGYLYQGQRYAWQQRRRGTPTTGMRPAAFVNYLENHDQLANSERGERIHRLSSPGAYRALTALLLLGPSTPLLFQGQEYGSTRPYRFFADHGGELAKSVRRGRAEFLRQFPHLSTSDVQASLTDPADPATFEACKLDPAERERNGGMRALHRDLLRLRREDPVIRLQGAAGLDGAVLTDDAFVVRFAGREVADRLLVVNLGPDTTLQRAPEPLLAPPLGRAWRTVWCSEDPRYGGRGCAPLEMNGGWHLPGQAAALLAGDGFDAAEEEADQREGREDGMQLPIDSPEGGA